MNALLAIAGLMLAACAPVEAPDATPVPQRCDAAASQSLIGSHVGAVDFQAGANVRVVCTTCPTTKDLQLDRLNIRFNQASGIIERVDCG
ncbi:MAG: hypothetical protein PSV23_05880 [Brevundimonas sp.]|uniref:hypothetical protein n=1 Tax=Brevundimonas sp. TaxID=1871086 RepID=UPI00248972A3|nr:hypothetical protein [Brevundimonas sp.]MDI1326313.1 hypothetical protein [Brevundimonas sp.]